MPEIRILPVTKDAESVVLAKTLQRLINMVDIKTEIVTNVNTKLAEEVADIGDVRLIIDADM